MERITSQKEIILNYLKNVKTHPSAEDVYSSVKKDLPRISKSTVYRILKNLAEKGEIQELKGDISHYDGDISFHSHFFCEKCQKIFDIFEKYEDFKNKKLDIGKIKKYQIYFYGYCKNCKKTDESFKK